MEFITHNQKSIDIQGTSLQGYIDVPYALLKSIFGEPNDGDGYKADAEWEIEFGNGTIAAIYNYKNGRNYLGGSGLDAENITDWHIGGLSKDSLIKVKEAVRESTR